MRNFITNFRKILEICKQFAGNHVNEKGNVARYGVIQSYDMTAANVHDLQYLKDVHWEYHDCMILGDKGYLSAPIQLNLFETANITLDVPYRLNKKN